MKGGQLVLLTGVSGSGKSTVAEYLQDNRNFKLGQNYTTRPERDSDKEGDYIYLPTEHFVKRIELGLLNEFMYYNGHFYGISVDFNKIEEGESVVAVVDPCGAIQLAKECRLKGIPYKHLFLDIPSFIQKDRLMSRGDGKVIIEKRQDDYKYFDLPQYDEVIDASQPLGCVISDVINALK